MNSELNLAPLEIPLEPSWWPLPTIFWLLIMGISLAGVTCFAIWHAKSKTKRFALRQLIAIEHSANLPALDRLLRQVALTHFTREEVAGLSGKAWLEWLDRDLAEPKFQRLEPSWHTGLYQQISPTQRDWQDCIEASREWIKQLRMGARC
ncbi:DUF4381 domain-containing protein [Vibrio sp. WXL103]|uniref:DUF4381 domain-containing protein n=1 Tax=unclassified Vibrio TaxID=2614977 RepID=UPI003EC73ED9